ncbi:MAG: hypothetical protein WBK55_08320 [Alphaproteobacteria bacterium]
MSDNKDSIFKKFGKIVLIVLTAILAAVGYFAYGVKPDTNAVLKGDVSAVGQQVEDAASAP